MRLTLFVPGLLLPGEVHADTVYDLAAPALALIAGRGRHSVLPADWLSAAFGLPAPLPAAALRRLASAEFAQGGDEWLCLDPVHWQVKREGVTLSDPAHLALDADEAAALIAAIQPLFADWGEIAASAPERWEMRLARPLALETRPLPETIGRRVDPRLPAGADGKTWRTLLAEAQTMLHAHPVNRARDARGQLPINSLWPWGQGALPPSARCDFTAAWSADPLVAGLCVFAGVPCGAPPDRFASAAGHLLCCNQSLATPARALDALAWRNALLALEEHWLAPVLATLRAGRLRELRLIGTRLGSADGALSFTLRRGDLLRFWRRPRPLKDLA